MQYDERHSSPFFTIKELYQANDCKIGINSLRNLIKAGRIKHVKLGKKYLIPKSELPRLVDLGDST